MRRHGRRPHRTTRHSNAAERAATMRFIGIRAGIIAIFGFGTFVFVKIIANETTPKVAITSASSRSDVSIARIAPDASSAGARVTPIVVTIKPYPQVTTHATPGTPCIVPDAQRIASSATSACVHDDWAIAICEQGYWRLSGCLPRPYWDVNHLCEPGTDVIHMSPTPGRPTVLHTVLHLCTRDGMGTIPTDVLTFTETPIIPRAQDALTSLPNDPQNGGEL